MRRVTVVTNGLFKKGKETNTTKRRSQKKRRFAEGICWDLHTEGPGKSSELLPKLCWKISSLFTSCKVVWKMLLRNVLFQLGKLCFRCFGGWRVGKCMRTNVRLVKSSGGKDHVTSAQPEPTYCKAQFMPLVILMLEE